jgi:hypothetical protein
MYLRITEMYSQEAERVFQIKLYRMKYTGADVEQHPCPELMLLMVHRHTASSPDDQDQLMMLKGPGDSVRIGPGILESSEVTVMDMKKKIVDVHVSLRMSVQEV